MNTCASGCSKIREVKNSNGIVTGIYKEKELMVEQRDCLNEQNFFSCRDYANVNGDTDKLKSENVRQENFCNRNICSGNISSYFYRILYFSLLYSSMNISDFLF